MASSTPLALEGKEVRRAQFARVLSIKPFTLAEYVKGKALQNCRNKGHDRRHLKRKEPEDQPFEQGRGESGGIRK